MLVGGVKAGEEGPDLEGHLRIMAQETLIDPRAVAFGWPSVFFLLPRRWTCLKTLLIQDPPSRTCPSPSGCSEPLTIGRQPPFSTSTKLTSEALAG